MTWEYGGGVRDRSYIFQAGSMPAASPPCIGIAPKCTANAPEFAPNFWQGLMNFSRKSAKNPQLLAERQGEGGMVRQTFKLTAGGRGITSKTLGIGLRSKPKDG
jgi:hypothetical protein